MRHLVAMLAALLAPAILAAPVPPVREKKAPPVAAQAKLPPLFHGWWNLEWSGLAYRTWLGPDGGYHCTSQGGTIWIGTWQGAPDGRLLFREAILDFGEAIADIPPERYGSWSATLERQPLGNVANPADIHGRAIYSDGTLVVIRLLRPEW